MDGDLFDYAKKAIAVVAVLIVAASITLGICIAWAMYELTIQNRPDRPAVQQTQGENHDSK